MIEFCESSMLRYFFQFISRLVIGGVTVIGDISIKIGLWSDESLLKLVISICRGTLISPLSRTCGLYLGDVGKCVGVSGPITT